MATIKIEPYLSHKECGDGGCQEVVGQEVYEGEDHHVEDAEGELVTVQQKGVERMATI